MSLRMQLSNQWS